MQQGKALCHASGQCQAWATTTRNGKPMCQACAVRDADRQLTAALIATDLIPSPQTADDFDEWLISVADMVRSTLEPHDIVRLLAVLLREKHGAMLEAKLRDGVSMIDDRETNE